MGADINKWRRVVIDTIDSLADEAMQRRSWFGHGPEVGSPDEVFCRFFDDAAVEEFLERTDSRLNREQSHECKILLDMMRKLSDQTPQFIAPESLIDDPRWIDIRRQAARVSQLLLEDQRP